MNAQSVTATRMGGFSVGASDSSSQVWIWYEYPIGVVGEIVRAFERTLLPFLIGLGGTFALLLGVGMMADEGLLGDPGVANAVDALLGQALMLLMVGAVVVWGAYAVVVCLREVTTSRAIVRATRASADRHRVPTPEQIVSVVREPAEQLKYFAWSTGAMAALMGVIGVGIAFTRDDDMIEVLKASGSALAWAAAMVPLGFYVPQRLTAAHERRQKTIAAFWSTEDEGKAWKRARPDRSQPQLGAGAFRLPDKLIYAATLVMALGFVILQLSVGARCSVIPGSRPAQQCDTTHYDSILEQIIGWGFGAFVGAMVIALLLAACGVLLDWRQRRLELNDLRQRLDGASSVRPTAPVLARHSGRHTHPIVRMMAILSAFVLVVGLSSYWAGKHEDSELEVFYSPHQGLELVTAAVGLALLLIAMAGTVLVNMSGREFRNLLSARWPVGPAWSAGEDGRVLRAKAGPALHAARYKKVGKGKRSSTAAPY